MCNQADGRVSQERGGTIGAAIALTNPGRAAVVTPDVLFFNDFLIFPAGLNDDTPRRSRFYITGHEQCSSLKDRQQNAAHPAPLLSV